jgi:hypothetical protein
MDEGIVPLAGFHDDIAAMTAIAARRPAPRYEFFAAESHAAVAAVARLDSDYRFINEHAVSVNCTVLARDSTAKDAKGAKEDRKMTVFADKKTRRGTTGLLKLN